MLQILTKNIDLWCHFVWEINYENIQGMSLNCEVRRQLKSTPFLELNR